MTEQEILHQLQDIFTDVLDNEDIQLTDASSADDIEEWDSINHIQLIVAVEKHFKVKFNNAEIQRWKKVGDMIASIKAKLG